MKLLKYCKKIKDKIVYRRIIKIYRNQKYEIRELIDSDIEEMNKRNSKNENFLYWFKNFPQYRNLFYYRIGCEATKLKNKFPEYPLFFIGAQEGIGKNAYVLNHPYCTILNAKKIGDNFTCCHLTTIGNKNHGENDKLPIIGNNVSLGANVTIIGNIKIGNNVSIGAGTVVVKDIPDNCIVVGNPSRIVKFKEKE